MPSGNKQLQAIRWSRENHNTINRTDLHVGKLIMSIVNPMDRIALNVFISVIASQRKKF